MHEVTFLCPKDLQDAVRLYRTTPGCRPLAGGTDLMVMLHARTLRPQPRAVLDIWSLAELKGVRRHSGMLEIGAAESYTGIIRSREAHRHVPALVAAARTIGAAQIQNRGTLGGNLANASPAGDTLPILLAYDAVVVTDRRSIPIDQFFTGYRKTALQPDELITAVRFPQGRDVVFRKVGTRAAQAISKVMMAVSRKPARIAIGSVAEVPLRARGAEAALERGDVDGAIAAVADDIRPIDDVRSTADYRRTVTQNVLRELLSVG
ncbi:MAG: carbon monoxide dehydrogenase [Gemmatimonadetes bacterium]|nr:MAG: carbon monoxide dehydrogenase [Gemmatimonadota bacterium]